MLRIFSLTGLLALCLLLSTCSGTFRAIDDDYADDYVIRDIRPLAGVSGEEVTFQATICENAGAIPVDINGTPGVDGPQIIWNFGSGAEPNVSYEAEPTVTLRDGIRGPYQCSVTYRDTSGGCGNFDVTATFDLNVAPLSVMAVSPLTGTGGGTAVFSSIIGSGTVTDYAWDFGGACSPNGSNVENPSVTFVETGGVFSCRLIISNSFEVSEFPFTLQIQPAPAS